MAASRSAVHHGAEGGLIWGLLDDEEVGKVDPPPEGLIVLPGELEGGVAGLDGPGPGRKVRPDEHVELVVHAAFSALASLAWSHVSTAPASTGIPASSSQASTLLADGPFPSRFLASRTA